MKELAVVDTSTGEYIAVGDVTVNSLTEQLRELFERGESDNWVIGKKLTQVRLLMNEDNKKYGEWCSDKLSEQNTRSLHRLRLQFEVFGDRKDDETISRIPQSSRYQLAMPEADEYREALIESLPKEGRISIKMVEALLPSLKDENTKNQVSSETNEWYTPDHIIEKVFQVMGGVDLDPCSDPEGNVGAVNIFTQEDDGLSKEWFGRVFMNPPYGGETGEWCRYLIGQDVEQAIVLIAASTGTTYFHEMLEWADAVWFGKGKLQFKPHKDSESDGKNPTIYNVMFYKGSNVIAFKEQFNNIGKVIQLEK